MGLPIINRFFVTFPKTEMQVPFEKPTRSHSTGTFLVRGKGTVTGERRSLEVSGGAGWGYQTRMTVRCGRIG